MNQNMPEIEPMAPQGEPEQPAEEALGPWSASSKASAPAPTASRAEDTASAAIGSEGREAAAIATGRDVSQSSDDVTARPTRPDFVPEKFWDAERGEVRLEALARSYRELESKLGRMVALPKDPHDTAAIARLRRALGWPERPEEYDVRPSDPLMARDFELERRLHSAGFTQDQVQLVYDLAAERILPAVAEAVGELEAARARAELEDHFGGREAFTRVARQIRAWAEQHLEPEAYAALATSVRGVLAMHAMMRSHEPELAEAGETAAPLTLEALQEMMRDPRYWRDRDPEFVARVTRGFEQLYGT